MQAARRGERWHAGGTCRQKVADWPACAHVTGDSLCLIESTDTGAQRPCASGPIRYILSPVIAVGLSNGEARGERGEGVAVLGGVLRPAPPWLPPP